jgi:inner membrane protein
MSPLGHTVTSFSMTLTFMHFNGVRWGDCFSKLPAFMMNQDVSQFDDVGKITLIALGMLLGGRGPDRLEAPVFDRRKKIRRSLIPHRTLTHWPPLWIIMALFFHWLSGVATDVLIFEAAHVGYGFCLSSLLHLAMDVLTPMGIPLIKPFGQRTSLSLYKTDHISEWCFIFVLVASSQFLSKQIAF